MKYQFGTCEIDVDTHQLVVNGVSIAVEPRVFELLRHIVENSDRLISHDELIEAVWKGRIVSDSARGVHQCGTHGHWRQRHKAGDYQNGAALRIPLGSAGFQRDGHLRNGRAIDRVDELGQGNDVYRRTARKIL